MKIMFISDLHGSSYYAEKLQDLEKEFCPDKIVSVGDLLYHGPRNDLPKEYNTKKTAEILNSFKDKMIAVRGNCDSEVDQMVLEFPIMADYVIVNDGELDIFVTHGHLFSPENLPPIKCGAFVSGHIHLPIAEKQGSITILNPGSCSLPKEGNPPSCMLYENGGFRIINLETKEIFKEV